MFLDDLTEHVELILIYLLNSDVSFLVCYHGNVRAAHLGLLLLADLPEQVELVLIDLLNDAVNLLVTKAI